MKFGFKEDQTRFESVPQFGQELTSFLNQPDVLCLSPKLNWVAGGCLVLAQALVWWSNGQLEEGCFKRELNSIQFLDHAFAFWKPGDEDPWLIDGAGIHKPNKLIALLEDRKACSTREIHWAPGGKLAVGVISNSRISKELALRLSTRFGALDLNQLN
jgi:hypothetical protein